MGEGGVGEGVYVCGGGGEGVVEERGDAACGEVGDDGDGGKEVWRGRDGER